MVCDGKYDCPYAEEEGLWCMNRACSNMFKCNISSSFMVFHNRVKIHLVQNYSLELSHSQAQLQQSSLAMISQYKTVSQFIVCVKRRHFGLLLICQTNELIQQMTVSFTDSVIQTVYSIQHEATQTDRRPKQHQGETKTTMYVNLREFNQIRGV